MPDMARIAAALRQLADALDPETDTRAPLSAVGAAGRGPIRNVNDSGNGMAVLSAAQFGQRFERSAAWAKDLFRRAVVPGAFRLANRAWRVPESAVAAYVEAQKAPTDVIPLRPRQTGSIADWRKVKHG